MGSWWHLVLMVIVFTILGVDGQNTRVQNGSQNATGNSLQVTNFRIPGARLLGFATLFSALSSRFGGNGFVGRCLGYARKLRMLMPFLIFKLGVIMTTLGFLTIFSLKGLAMTMLLLVMNAGAWVSKIAFLKGISTRSPAWTPWNPAAGPIGPLPPIGRLQNLHSGSPPAVHLHVHKDHRNDAYTVVGNDGYTYSSDKHYPSSADEDYDASNWRDRISKGFDVNSMLKKDLEASGVNVVYPRRVVPTADPVIR